ncbi:helix-turn-helix transcriptional regulator [Streptomyces sp. NPDC059740]|uniref:helix-turn-helix transcriptional regulator n=1 Tax=Streptomyces sp. NPDC059740 TaxID=3346926 RepID=UPI003654535A
MPDKPEREEEELETIPAIAARRGHSRQYVGRLARENPDFPRPVLSPGSTRIRYRRQEVDEFFNNRVLRPGQRTDLEKKREKEKGVEGHPPEETGQ